MSQLIVNEYRDLWLYFVPGTHLSPKKDIVVGFSFPQQAIAGIVLYTDFGVGHGHFFPHPYLCITCRHPSFDAV